MRKLEDQTGVQASNPDYVKGRIVNNQTPIIEEIYGDVIETIHRIVYEEAITENALPDNDTNGHQILEAMEKHFSLANSWINFPIDETYYDAIGAGSTLKYRKHKDNTVEIKGYANRNAGASIQPLGALPAGYRPLEDYYFTATNWDSTRPSKETFSFVVRTTGVVDAVYSENVDVNIEINIRFSTT